MAITLEEEVFDTELENKSSARYQDLKKNVEIEVTLSITGVDFDWSPTFFVF